MGCCFSAKDAGAIPPPQIVPPAEPSSRLSLGSNAAGKRKNPQDIYKENNNQPNRGNPSIIIDNQQEQNDLKKKDLSLVHKTRGNEYFKNKQYKPAIKEYTIAIDLYAQDPVYYSNRALCFKFLAQYKEVINDADSSLRLNKTNYKAFHLKGVALIELGKSEVTTTKVKEGLSALETSLSLVQGSDPNTKNDIEVKVNRAKKVLWLKDKEYSENEAVKTTAYVKKLIGKDSDLPKDQKQQMEDLFNQFVTENNKKRFTKEVPESLCCKITFELMKEPAISSSGVTYEKETLIEHLNKVGKFDPFTRQPLYQSDLIKNNSITKATLDFQIKNPWSYESVDLDEDYRKIAF